KGTQYKEQVHEAFTERFPDKPEWPRHGVAALSGFCRHKEYPARSAGREANSPDSVLLNGMLRDGQEKWTALPPRRYATEQWQAHGERTGVPKLAGMYQACARPRR